MPGDRHELHLEGLHSTLAIRRPSPRTVLVVISGRDVGEFRDAPFRELQRLLPAGSASLFIDARHALSVSIEVSAAWARFLVAHRARLERVVMLTSTRFVSVTASVVRRFADLGEAMRVTDDPREFEAALARSTGGAGPQAG